MLLNLSFVGYNRGLDGGDLAPAFNEDGTVKITHCNQFINYILNGLGYDAMSGKTANDMYDFMKEPSNGWISPADESVVQAHANAGVIVLAARKAQGHGHICLVLPGILEKSGSFGRAVPKVVNIGKDVFFGKRISWAFRGDEQPDYFALYQMI